jgi:hypothetical protein
MAINDKRGLEGMPLKLLIVSLLISISAPIVLSSMSTFQTKTSVSEALGVAENIRETITATYISGPGNHRVMDSPLTDNKCTIEIGGSLDQTESMVIKVKHDGGVDRIYLSDPAVRVTTSDRHPFQLTSDITKLSFTCVGDNMTYIVVSAS